MQKHPYYYYNRSPPQPMPLMPPLPPMDGYPSNLPPPSGMLPHQFYPPMSHHQPPYHPGYPYPSNFQSMMSYPPRNYICRKCHVPGHWIDDCNKNSNKNSNNSNSSSCKNRNQPSLDNRNETFTCKPCEKSFRQESQYQAHLNTHETCRVKGCTFSGSRKVISAHYHATHGKYSGDGLKEIDIEGHKFNVLVGYSPEDISKWREERRQRWPTKQNVEEKEKEMVAKELEKTRKRKLLESQDAKDDDGEAAKTVKVARSDDVNEVNSTSSKKQIVEDPNVDEKLSVQKPKSKKLCKYYRKGKCQNGENCLYSHAVKKKVCDAFLKGKCTKGTECRFNHDEQAKINKMDKDKEKTVHQQKSTLLRKLLAKDIHQEQIFILQCFRHIVENTNCIK